MEDLLKTNPFRTDFRTEKKFVLMNTRFIPRTSYKDKNGECRMYLSITSRGQRKRISLDFYVKKGEFDLKTQKIIGTDPKQKDIQLYIDNINAKITRIRTDYHLIGKYLLYTK
jgi:hypothetical protein